MEKVVAVLPLVWRQEIIDFIYRNFSRQKTGRHVSTPGPGPGHSLRGSTPTCRPPSRRPRQSAWRTSSASAPAASIVIRTLVLCQPAPAGHLLVHRAPRVLRPVVDEGEDAARPAVGVAPN